MFLIDCEATAGFKWCASGRGQSMFSGPPLIFLQMALVRYMRDLAKLKTPLQQDGGRAAIMILGVVGRIARGFGEGR